MKHTLKITLILLFLFLFSQLIGLAITKDFLTDSLPYGLERPEIKEETSYIHFIVLILVVTTIALIMAKLKLESLWKIWFFLSVLIILTVSFSSFLQQTLAFILALFFALIKVLKNNVYIHNFTELFLYGGIAAIFVPIMNLSSISILLVLISVYDIIAVFKTKHMITLAKFQAKVKLFAGLYIPYKNKEAILGGGDMAFPLLFSGVMLKEIGNLAFIAPFIITMSLFFLFYIGKKNKFYPAMPILTLGCFLSYLIIKLISLQ